MDLAMGENLVAGRGIEMMRCPTCGRKTYVLDSRVRRKGTQRVIRRRECSKCGRFTTSEVAILKTTTTSSSELPPKP